MEDRTVSCANQIYEEKSSIKRFCNRQRYKQWGCFNLKICRMRHGIVCSKIMTIDYVIKQLLMGVFELVKSIVPWYKE